MEKMTLNWVREQYAAGATVREVLNEVRARIVEWEDPATFLYLPSEEQLEALAAEVEAMDRSLPLWGVPFVAKDNIDVAGWPTTAACPSFGYVPTADAGVVSSLRAAGAIPVGKGNLDQFATGLVGTRSPHGTARNAVAPEWLPGGSSSGSASAVAAGICVFSLGTDTAGSGRVPAAFQELIGWKPSKGLLSTTGVVPACRSLDCVSVFAHSVADAAEIMNVAAVFDETDPYARTIGVHRPLGRRIGVPRELDFAGDPDTPGLFAAAVERAAALGFEVVEIDLTPFVEAAKLLYEGPWVAERWAAVGDFVEAHPDEIFPVTRKILEGSRGWDAAQTFKAQDQLRAWARQAEKVWRQIDLLLLPTTPCLYRVEAVIEEPYRTNATLGRYTNFMNLLDLCAVAIPAGRARDGQVPWGVTLAAPAGADASLLAAAATFTGEKEARPLPLGIPVVVCGAHLEGLALHHQLVDRGARFVARTTTAACYRLYAMPASGDVPVRPALVRDEFQGAEIAVEVWSLDAHSFGEFVAGIPGPLGIGKVKLADGQELPGFIAESRAILGAEEITAFGGWRAWLATG
ncbi:allophanate hydrolase [Haloferula luteola]|uniref:Allophanate hydrolase n=1 Tax=Haloferula luteola TaxID=595692 RepID=A0A840V884_9BACT|nr:allophanate hydrolase [Haloferula luteola]MBB5350948.1 allophanate hydrolase [Haloferula luteola]